MQNKILDLPDRQSEKPDNKDTSISKTEADAHETRKKTQGK
jgi:hypothetical protein